MLYLLTPQVPETVAQVRAAVAAARACGVRRIVRQSLCHADTGRDTLSRWHREAEAVIAASGLAYTFLRPNSFMQNFVTIYSPAIRGEDRFRLPLGSAAMSSVDVRDVAAAATAVLIDEVDDDVYTLTGPEAPDGRRDGGRPDRGHRPPDHLRRRARRRRPSAGRRGPSARSARRCASSATRCARVGWPPSPATSSVSPAVRRSASPSSPATTAGRSRGPRRVPARRADLRNHLRTDLCGLRRF